MTTRRNAIKTLGLTTGLFATSGVLEAAPKKKKEKVTVNPKEDPLFDLSTTIQKYLIEKKPFLNPDFEWLLPLMLYLVNIYQKHRLLN